MEDTYASCIRSNLHKGIKFELLILPTKNKYGGLISVLKGIFQPADVLCKLALENIVYVV